MHRPLPLEEGCFTSSRTGLHEAPLPPERGLGEGRHAPCIPMLRSNLALAASTMDR